MKKINIAITKAKIISYSVDLNDDTPDVTATIGLFTGADKQISTFSLSTKSWHEAQFEIPFEMINPIKEIAQELETILIRECSSAIGLLSEKVQQR